MSDKLYKWYYYGFLVILTLPVITSPILLRPTAWGKAILFRIFFSILIYVSILKWDIIKETLNKKINNSNRLPFWLLIGFLGLIILSTIFSLDPYFSFWGSPLRGDGSLNYIFYILFAILTFLVIKKTDWDKIWKFNIIIGALVSIIALFQRFGMFSKTFITYDGRPPATMGGPIFLALYLILLVYITLSFYLKTKKKRYLLSFLLFVYVLLLTGSRAAYFGLLIGFIYFILAYPLKNKLTKIVKISFVSLAILGALGIYYLNTNTELLNAVSSRLSIKLAVEDPRFSAWAVSMEAIKDRPLLGYGPENFSIAFDKYYNPSLPYISKEWGSWYDQAHSFIFAIAINSGIPALLVYLTLIGVLFWKLQKNKNIIGHGIQATFIAYLGANFFSFDVFSTYILFFLIVAYSLTLIKNEST